MITRFVCACVCGGGYVPLNEIAWGIYADQMCQYQRCRNILPSDIVTATRVFITDTDSFCKKGCLGTEAK